MWFEVNVRLSEVTDLKWPHGTEWQCANSTLAISWPNHLQILSFASMATRQVAVKHGSVKQGGQYAPPPPPQQNVWLTRAQRGGVN